MRHATFPSRIPGFDGLRAFACLWVILVHFSQASSDTSAADWNPALLAFGLRGEQGVPFFFLLSGFLLALPFVIGQRHPGQRREYIVDRMSRIFPAYLLCVGTMAALVLARRGMDQLGEVAIRAVMAGSCLTFLHPETVYPFPQDAALWSVPVEVWFYGMFLFAAAFIFGRAKNEWRNLLIVLAASVSVAIATPTVYAWIENTWDPLITPRLQWHLSSQHDWVQVHNPFTLFPSFLLGVGLCLATVPCYERLSRFRFRWLFDLPAVGLGVLLLGLDWQAIIDDRIGQSAVTTYGFPAFHLLAAGMMFCLIISRFTANVLDSTPLRQVARYSFGMYLWHLPVMFTLERFFVAHSAREAIAEFAAIVAVTFCVGGASYHLFEMPAQRWLRNRFGRRKAAENPSPEPSVPAMELLPGAG